MQRPTTHEEIFLNFVKSTQKVIDAVQAKNDSLKESGDYDEKTQFHKTGVIIRRWFNDRGGLAI